LDRQLTKFREKNKTTSIEISDQIEIGQWYWVKDVEEDGGEVLCCISDIGSNYVEAERYSVRIPNDIKYDPSDSHYSFRIHLDDFDKRCRKEDNWNEYFTNRLKSIQAQIKQKTQLLVQEGKRLFLINREREEQINEGEILPSIVSISPIKYRNELIEFRKNSLPKIQREIKALSVDFAMMSKNMALTDFSKLEFIKSQFNSIEDKIFTIEIYAGIHENIKQIAEGSPASIDEPIAIRQQLLFMDEECLIDFNKGGMDFERLEDFDRWVVKPENLNRILLEKKGIVAFQVRRHKKDYPLPNDLWGIFQLIQKDYANMETYLLIRNGHRVYRVTSVIDFSPRLVPFKNEIGEKQFQKVYRGWSDEPDTVEKITPDHIEYDDHFKKMADLIKKYNKIFIFIQGLLDRSDIFHPHLGIKLNKQEHMDLWIKCIRDEELGLPSNMIDFEEYRKQLNKSLKSGDLVWSDWVPENMGHYSYQYSRTRHNLNEEQVAHRPDVCRVTSIKRDRSAVWIVWEVDVQAWDYERMKDKRNRHLLVPIDKIFNISDYNPGDYRMFLCDRTLQGKYLEWAPMLLTAEKMSFDKEGVK